MNWNHGIMLLAMCLALSGVINLPTKEQEPSMAAAVLRWVCLVSFMVTATLTAWMLLR